MRIKPALIVMAAAAVIIVAALFNRHAPSSTTVPHTEMVAAKNPAQEQPVVPPSAAPVADEPAPVPASPEQSPVTAPAQSVTSSDVATTTTPKPASQKPPIQDPIARVALSFVGVDADAEAYWMQAINDPTLPAEERKDLVEDLNEDGLTNPQLAGPDDFPLIANRILLIEDLAPYTTDPVIKKAFNEAYKDLVNLYNGLPAD